MFPSEHIIPIGKLNLLLVSAFSASRWMIPGILRSPLEAIRCNRMLRREAVDITPLFASPVSLFLPPGECGNARLLY